MLLAAGSARVHFAAGQIAEKRGTDEGDAC